MISIKITAEGSEMKAVQDLKLEIYKFLKNKNDFNITIMEFKEKGAYRK